DALEEWPSSALVVTSSDGITWWTAMQATGHPLACMSLDFLSTPATLTDVKQAFSHGGLTVSKMQHSLSDESTCASTLLGSWVPSFPDLIPCNDIVTLF
ncbi:hypothetical protein L208DRAFT_1057755, partial [Tricholoma matsutake]